MTLTIAIHTGSCTLNQLHLPTLLSQTTCTIVCLKIHCFTCTFFPYKSIREQIWTCRKIGHGQPRVIIWTNLVVIEHPMLHTNFQGHQSFGLGEEHFLWFLPYMGMAVILVECEQNFFPPTHGVSIWHLASTGPMASEEMFENVDDLRLRPTYHISSPMSLRLTWAKNGEHTKIKKIFRTVIFILWPAWYLCSLSCSAFYSNLVREIRLQQICLRVKLSEYLPLLTCRTVRESSAAFIPILCMTFFSYLSKFTRYPRQLIQIYDVLSAIRKEYFAKSISAILSPPIKLLTHERR